MPHPARIRAVAENVATAVVLAAQASGLAGKQLGSSKAEVTAALKKEGISCKLDLIEGSMTVATTRKTWILFCCVFGVLHGCAVTSMVYASSLQGKDLSSASLGAFFAAYTIAALFIATDVVRRVGVLHALLAGFCGYVLLAASYLSYKILGGGAVADAVVILASIGAGVGGATLWVGQTQHYAQASAAHAEAQQIPAKEASAGFATLFAVIYVTMEACVKVATAVAKAFLRPTSRNTGDTPWMFTVSDRGKSCTASESLMILWQCTLLTHELTNLIAASFTAPCSSKRAYSR